MHKVTAFLKQHLDGPAHQALALAVGAFPSKVGSQPRDLPVTTPSTDPSAWPTMPCGCVVNRNINDPVPNTCNDPTAHAGYVQAEKRKPRAQSPYPGILGPQPYQNPGTINTNAPTHENVAVVEFECPDEASARAVADKLKGLDAEIANITLDGVNIDQPVATEPTPEPPTPAPVPPINFQ